MNFGLVYEHREVWPVRAMCVVMGLSVGGYYAWRGGLENRRAAADRTLLDVTVPGALEIPAAIAIAMDAARSRREPYDGVIALGCVILGETYHFEIVSNESARGLMDLAVNERLPVGNGILTVDNETQALARAHPEEGDKGGDAARAALTMVALKHTLAWR